MIVKYMRVSTMKQDVARQELQLDKLGVKFDKEYVDKIVANAKDLWKSLDISYDKFIRTTDEEHVKCVQKIFERLYKQGDIYKGEYKGLYCTPCESFWTETQLINGKWNTS